MIKLTYNTCCRFLLEIMKYYLAYGSNLNLNDMKVRCSSAKKVGSTILKDYTLIFRNRYLTIIPSKGDELPLGIFEINDEDEEKLDIYEGYPSLYYKTFINFEFNKENYKGLIYIMDDITNLTKPSLDYINTCKEGYLDFNFDYKYIEKALKELEEARKIAKEN